jgi:CubicO group peptidase (beta-lactamase class C family)
MQLVEAGQVELDVPVQRYIPWFTLADPEASAAITVRHLLHQTSGIPNAAGLALCAGTGESTIEREARGLRDVTPAFPPGTRFQYSNANYVVLGALVEAVAAEPFGEYVQTRIFEPLQMRDSYVSQREAEERGLATGYRRWFGFPLPSDPPFLPDELPAGYLIASAEDIGHYLVANLNGGAYEGARVLSAAGIAQLHTPVAEAGDASYGMGWVVGAVGGMPAVYHHGSTPNYHSTMLLDPAGGRGVVVVTNVNLFEMWHVGPSSVIAEGVLQLLRGGSAPARGPTVSLRYLAADLIALALTGLAGCSFVLLPRWRRHLLARPPQGALAFGRRVALPILVDATWSLTILFAFPDISNLPSWRFWTLYQPDFAGWLIAIAELTATKAVMSVVLAYGAIRDAWRRLGWQRVLAASVLAEAAFMALFVVAMLTASGPAMFVAELLAAAFALDLIALIGPRASQGRGETVSRQVLEA